jgi:molybdopterin molybdotransferase
LISVEDALSRVLALSPPLGVESVPLAQAAGRMMATPAIARRDQPPFPASAMDGYAVSDSPQAGARLRVIGMAAAGHGFDGTLASGEALRIFTGAPVPAGASHVVLQEDVEVQGETILLLPTVDQATNIRPRGQDFRAGDNLPPRLLRPADLALLSAMNLPEVTVHRRPVVALIATGDELVMPGETPREDQIIASNHFALKAMAEAEGAEVRMLPIARDNEVALATVLGLAEGADIVVTIGGASVGDHDLVGRVAEGMGLDRAFYKIAMRPGKPLMAGRLRGAAMLGLPGNPVSAIVCGHLFLLPMIRAMQGRPPGPLLRQARLAVDLGPNGPRAHYMRARLGAGDGLPRITPFDRQDSALLHILTEADALLVRPVGEGARTAGDEVQYLPL